MFTYLLYRARKEGGLHVFWIMHHLQTLLSKISDEEEDEDKRNLL